MRSHDGEVALQWLDEPASRLSTCFDVGLGVAPDLATLAKDIYGEDGWGRLSAARFASAGCARSKANLSGLKWYRMQQQRLNSHLWLKVFDSVSLYAIERKARSSWNYSMCVYKDLFIVLWSVKCHFDNDKKLSDMFFVTESQLDYLESSDSER